MVMRVIKEHNYIPNNSARNLKRSDAKAIAVLVKGITNPFFNDMIGIIEQETQQKKYTFTAIDSFAGADIDDEKDSDKRNKLIRDYCIDGIKRIIQFIEGKNIKIEKSKELKRRIQELEEGSRSRNPERSARKNEKIVISSDDESSEEDADFDPNAKESSSSSSEEEEEVDGDASESEDNDEESN